MLPFRGEKKSQKENSESIEEVSFHGARKDKMMRGGRRTEPLERRDWMIWLMVP